MAIHTRGIIHVHSKYSHDGTMGLSQLKELCKEKGLRFIALTEHAESMDEGKMNDFLAECAALSDKDSIIIPGLEYICCGMHILAIGTTEIINESEPEKLVEKIKALGGLASLAHVVYYESIPYEKLKNLDGIEIWNPRYDSRFSPSLKALNILKRFREVNKNILAFSGLDLHKKSGIRSMITVIHTEVYSREDVIKALRTGGFHSKGQMMRFDPQKDPRNTGLPMIYCLTVVYCCAQTAKKIGRKMRLLK
jgi:hypothetical protein